jgi:hypothetical protein
MDAHTHSNPTKLAHIHSPPSLLQTNNTASLAQAPAAVRAGPPLAATDWPYRNTPAAAPSPLPHHHHNATASSSSSSSSSSTTTAAAAAAASASIDPAVAAAAAEVSAHHPLFQHVEPDSLSYSLGRSVSIGGRAGAGGGGDGGHHEREWIEYSLPGQMSGELGLFTKELRRYTCVALAPQTVIWRIDVSTLNAMVTQDPQAYIVLQKLALFYASHRLHCLVFHGQLHSV